MSVFVYVYYVPTNVFLKVFFIELLVCLTNAIKKTKFYIFTD